jgi:hypothetical protein
LSALFLITECLSELSPGYKYILIDMSVCSDNQHVFIPFVFDTFGFFASNTVNLLKIIQKIMHSNVVSPKSINVFFLRLGFAIQKGLAAQLVISLPSNYSCVII